MGRIILLFLALALGNVSTLSSETQRLDGVVDVAQFVLGDTELWPRTGDHGMNQVFDPKRKFLFFVKFGNPNAYEVLSWDDQWVYHHEDKGSGFPYSLNPGRWMKRFMKVGETIDNSDNRLTEYNSRCQVIGEFSFPYKNTLEAYWPNFDCGPDLGRRDVIVLRFTPFTASNYYERFFYVKGAGWAAWQEWQYGVLQRQSIFNLLGGVDVQPGIQPCRPPRR